LGNASFKLLHLPTNQVAALKSSGGRTNTVSAADPSLEIVSDSYEFVSSEALFRGHVEAMQAGWKLTCRALKATILEQSHTVQEIVAEEEVRVVQKTSERLGAHAPAGSAPSSMKQESDVPWSLSCELMHLYAISNQVDRIEAERNVIFEDKSGRATGGYAIYTATNDLVQLTNNPTLVLARGSKVSAPLLILDRKRSTFVAQGSFAGEVPGEALGNMDQVLPDPSRLRTRR
jgi:lipopolysaccharide export system protein LptA